MRTLNQWALNFTRTRRQFGGGTPRLLGAAFLAAFTICTSIVLSLVWELDRRAAVDARTMMAGALEREIDGQTRSTANTAHWDEAVLNLYGNLNESWATSNITKPTHVYVIDYRGATLFVGRADKTPGRPLVEAAPAAAQGLLPRLPRNPANELDGRQAHSILTIFDGAPAIISASAILPETKAVRVPSGKLRYLLYVEEIDSAVLRRWGESFRLAGLSWSGTARARGAQDGLPVEVTGGPAKHLVWKAPEPGVEALSKLRALIAAAIIVFAGLCAWIIRLFVRTGREIEAGLQNATANATAEYSAKLAAEAALAQSRQDQQRLVDMIKQQVADEQRHRIELAASAGRMADAIEQVVSQSVEHLLGAARKLEGNTADSLHLIEAQQSQARDVQQRSSAAGRSVVGIADAIKDLDAMLTAVGTDTGASRKLIAEAAQASAAMEDASLTLCARVDAIMRAAEEIALITARTGTLALNATIEAARAGEAGRGFMVVAGEVKSLAAQTAQLNTEVQASIAQIRSAVRSGADLAGDMHLTLEQLATSARVTLRAVDEHRDATRELGRTSRGIDDYAQVVVAGTDALVASLDLISERVCSTRSVGAAVRENAEALQVDLKRFVGDLKKSALDGVAA